MRKILVFSGTTEGRSLVEILSQNGIECDVCVATEYGEQVMPELENVKLMVGRLTLEEMKLLLEGENYEVVIDATHPFAELVSGNIKEAAEECDLRYIRLKRSTSYNDKVSSKIRCFENNEQCRAALSKTKGAILLTTGSKELAHYCKDEELRKRLYVRVLPGEESVKLCYENGLVGKQIIAMQGPFSLEMNKAIIDQYGIDIMVTKESGKTGGADEKLKAAEECGIEAFMISNPDKAVGYSFEDTIHELEKIYGKFQEVKNEFDISLIGIGMGNRDTLTIGALNEIEAADYIFGAERIIAPYSAQIEKKPFYLARDVIPYLKKVKSENNISPIRIAILFSGDTGFFSGCRKMAEELKNAGYEKVKILPGISSISYLSGKTGIPWSEADIFSIHGRGEKKDWQGKLVERVNSNRNTFLLVSGDADIRSIGDVLMESDLKGCRLKIGYNLSYPDEQILDINVSECEKITEKGLYTCIISNDKAISKKLSSGICDEEFIRGKVPMTKEEVRHLSIEKLGLTENAIVYDIGSGTGSIAVEIAKMSESIKVYAIEQKEEAVELIHQNVEKFKAYNVEVIHGKAPLALEELTAPTHAFIGGSSGNMVDILELLYHKNPCMNIVVNAISLETISELTKILDERENAKYSFKISESSAIQLGVSRAKKLGNYHLMQAENPVMIFSFKFCRG